MRKLVVTSSVFLMVSGIVLAYPRLFPWAEESSAVYLLHLWAGFLFLVIFPIYSWDHIKTHANRLKKLSLLSLSGTLQLITGLGLIISGLPLLIYGNDVFELIGIIHFVLTFVLALCLILHKITRK